MCNNLTTFFLCLLAGITPATQHQTNRGRGGICKIKVEQGTPNLLEIISKHARHITERCPLTHPKNFFFSKPALTMKIIDSESLFSYLVSLGSDNESYVARPGVLGG